MKLEMDYHGSKYATATTVVNSDTQIQVQTVALVVHMTAQGVGLVDQRGDLLKSDDAYVMYARTGADGGATFEVLPTTQHEVRSTYGGVTWIWSPGTGPAEVDHDFG
jgi:hypothetical protein